MNHQIELSQLVGNYEIVLASSANAKTNSHKKLIHCLSITDNLDETISTSTYIVKIKYNLLSKNPTEKKYFDNNLLNAIKIYNNY